MSSDQEACPTPDLYSLGSGEDNRFSDTPTPDVTEADTGKHQQIPFTAQRRRAFREIHEGISKAFKNVVTSALPLRTRKNQTPQASQPIKLDRQPSVPPLQITDRVRGRSQHRSFASSAKRSAKMMTDARELFENHGIDRPPG